MLKVIFTKQMKRDVRRMQRRGKNMGKLALTLRLLVTQEPMPPNYRDHQLSGNLKDFRKCHVGGEGDWLLMYQIFEDKLVLSASGTGTHSDLFDE
jgi:mRNA interferase YafQ